MKTCFSEHFMSEVTPFPESKYSKAYGISGKLADELAKDSAHQPPSADAPEPSDSDRAAAVIPAAPPSLYKILEELSELTALAEDPELSDEERKAVEWQIKNYLGAEIVGRKVDGIAYTVRNFLANAAIARDEAERLNERAAAWEKRAASLKRYVMEQMQLHGIKSLESAGNRLRVQKNGGLAPLEIYDQATVPVFCKTATITMELGYWLQIVEETGIGSIPGLKVEISVNNDAVRDGFKGLMICPDCNGFLDVNVGCARCGGKGTVPAEVPGARLLERGSHLRVE